MEMAGNGVPGAVGQGCRALLSGLQVPWINGARKICQRVGGWAERELGVWCLTRSSSH
jgi:hypothetical protein